MKPLNYLSLGGLTAMIAGVLRVISSVIPTSDSVILKTLYFVIDVCLLSGVLGIYRFERERLGLVGLLAAILAIGGAGLLIVRDTVAWSTSLYGIAALMFSVGLSLLGIASWTTKKLPQWIYIFWVTATLVGILGYLVPALGILFVLSGMLLGVGFTGAGFIIWSSNTATRPAK
jgi:hypothetical protein